jgi:hypothetical protein
MTRCLSLVAVLALSWCRPALVSAQQVTDSVKAGMPVSVVDDAGTEIRGRVDSFSGDVIRIKRRDRLDEVPLQRIVRIEKTDSLKNGALTGMLVGGTAGLVMVIANTRSPDPGLILWATLGNAAVYGALGTAIDGMVQGRRTLYERGRVRETRIAPIVGPNVGGAVVRVSW